MTTSSIWLGLQEYSQTLQKQYALHKEVQSSGQVHILGVEHSPTITLGVRGSAKDDLKTPYPELQQKKIQIESTERGGQATLHSPGQLVIYPIVRLKDYNMGVRSFCDLLLQTTQSCLSSYQVESSFENSQVGLFTSRGKIMFLGLRVREGVSFHGLSININNDLSLFKHIRSCGQSSAQLDSLESQLITDTPSCKEVFLNWTKLFEANIKA